MQIRNPHFGTLRAQCETMLLLIDRAHRRELRSSGAISQITKTAKPRYTKTVIASSAQARFGHKSSNYSASAVATHRMILLCFAILLLLCCTHLPQSVVFCITPRNVADHTHLLVYYAYPSEMMCHVAHALSIFTSIFSSNVQLYIPLCPNPLS